MAARVKQIEERLKAEKMSTLQGIGEAVEAVKEEAKLEAKQLVEEKKVVTEEQKPKQQPPPRRPTGLDALPTEPSGSYEHFQPGAWKPIPGKRVKS